MKPASLSAATVRMTCSMHGLKQQMRAVRSVWAVSAAAGTREGGWTYAQRSLGVRDGVPRRGEVEED